MDKEKIKEAIEEKKLSEEFDRLKQRVKHLEGCEEELNMIRATLVVNFGENGKVKTVFKGDLTTMSMLMNVLNEQATLD